MKYHRTEGLQVEHKWAGKNDILTQADTASQEILVAGIKAAWYSHILSEESLHEPLDWSKDMRIIDPIDGTKMFTEWGTWFSILMARWDWSKIDAWYMYFPALSELYYTHVWAWSYRVAWGEVEKLTLSDPGMSFEEMTYSLQLWSERKRSEPDMSVLYDLVEWYWLDTGRVIFGREAKELVSWNIDFYIESYPALAKWDVAAPSILITEAGGKISDMYGKELDFTCDSDSFWVPLLAGSSWAHEFVVQQILKVSAS